jgi:tripartite-type tricarboxylate transporter receptor subunit TctC
MRDFAPVIPVMRDTTTLVVRADSPVNSAKLNAVFTTAINDPAVKQKLIDSGAIPASNTPEQFGQMLKEIARWGRVVREQGIKEPG